MPKRKKREHDFAVTAFHTLEQVIKNTEGVEPEPKKIRKEYDYKTLGRAGGLKGGKARAESLTKKQRQEIAKKAAQTRWKKKE